MHFADLSLSSQVLAYGLLAAAMVAFLTRAVIFFRRENAGLQPLYPSSWSAAQCRTLEWFRLVICLALIPLWGIFLFIAPSMPSNWPVGFVCFLSLILISHAWVVLLTPRNWKMVGPRSFWLAIMFLVVWWGATLTATGWMLAQASASPRVHVVPSIGVFAALNVSHLSGTEG
jgi:hypothetical protein